MRVSDIMSRDVVAVPPDTTLREAARLMLASGISGLPVVDARGKIIGVISESDFVLKERGRATRSRSPLRWLLGEARHDLARVEAATVREAMTAPAITIDDPSSSVRSAAHLMAARRINRLPVTELGSLIGIVTRADILRLYTQSDAAIEAAVRSSMPEVDGLELDSVRDGIVVLTGTIRTRTAMRSAITAIEAVDGVVRVDLSNLVVSVDEASPGSGPVDQKVSGFYLGSIFPPHRTRTARDRPDGADDDRD